MKMETVQSVQTRYMSLGRAAINGDWTTANRIFHNDPDAVTAKMLFFQETALHVAIRAGNSTEFVKNLIDKMTADSLGIATVLGENPLHYAAKTGNTEAAQLLVKKNPRLTQVRCNGETPLHHAASFAHRETVSYLLSVTLDEDPSPFADEEGIRLLKLLVDAEFYDIALDLLKRYPLLARVGKDHISALGVLSLKPQAFASRSRLGCFQRLLYHYFASNCTNTEGISKGGDVENPSGGSEKYQKKYSKNFQFPFLQRIQNTELMHRQAKELLKLLISETLKGTVTEADALLYLPTLVAAACGNQEFVEEVIKCYPGGVWFCNGDGHNIFHLAVKHRQDKIFNLLYQKQIGAHHILATSMIDNSGNNLLHLAAKLEPSNKISGAALQMQRELQWFKEVEKVLPPLYKDIMNHDSKTPRMLFTEEHKNLVEEGEKWMKDTATSSAIVAVLVLTVVFKAAFTAPGGNNSNQGIPIYLNETSFMIFAVSDALALFFSSTSVLIFLGTLTSRYSEEDFLKALPMRLSIGLITLFFSVASMLTAFSAAFYLVLFHRVQWIAVPIGLVACVPVALFVVLQFPILVAMVCSTFGPSIFHKQSQEMIF